MSVYNGTEDSLLRPRKKAAGVSTWLQLHSTGQTQVLELGKHAVIGRTGLPARDLRIVDPLLSYPSTVLGRERAIVVNLEHIKAIITPQEALFPNAMVIPFVDELQTRILRHNPKLLPFEFLVLEACLEAACCCLDNETETLEQEAYPALDKLTSKISTLNLERVRKIKTRLVDVMGRVQKVWNELEHLLGDDDDMAEMYLTEKLQDQLENSSVTSMDVKELEMLLEAYFIQTDGILNKLSNVKLREYVEDTEDYINIMHDDKQNHLLKTEVMLSTGSLAVNAFVVVTGVFGMNFHDLELFQEGLNGMPNFMWTVGGGWFGTLFLYVIAVAWYKHTRLLD